MVFSLWQDNKIVSALSTSCQIGEGTVKQKRKDGTRMSVTCPFNIIEYNKYMGGFDHSDQLRQYYCVRLKTCKFYLYIFVTCHAKTRPSANFIIFRKTITNTEHERSIEFEFFIS